jgi:flagellar protein FliO/FliZ
MKSKTSTLGSTLAQTTRAACVHALFVAVDALVAAARGTARRATRAQVARALCGFVLFSAVGALGSAAAFAQEVQQQVQNAPAAAPARPFGAPSVATGVAPSGIASLGQVTLALGLVLALIFVAAWLMRRLKGFGKTGTGVLDIIAELPLSQKERAVLIRVGTQQVLVGVAPGRVSTLHVLDEPVDISPAGGTTSTSITNPGSTSAERPTFKSLLMKSLGK